MWNGDGDAKKKIAKNKKKWTNGIMNFYRKMKRMQNEWYKEQ